jgi:hypothetical protein
MTLQQDSIGERVTQLQTKLQSLGFGPNTVDGHFGPATKAAVIAFQKSANLSPDGIAGPSTLTALGLDFPESEPAVASDPSVGITAMKFDHDKFFAGYKEQFGPISSNSKLNGIESLLTQLESDGNVEDERWAAYMFATVKHECADTWQPIEEFGKGKGHRYGQPVQVTGSDGQTHTCAYYGRGYVQLTWDYNYKKMSAALGMDDALLIHPEQVMEPDVAYKIMSFGMRNGSFTGKKLGDYINDAKCDYLNARRIINALDKAALIRTYAEKLQRCFTGSRIALAQDASVSAGGTGGMP